MEKITSTMRLKELIDKLRDAHKLFGDIDVHVELPKIPHQLMRVKNIKVENVSELGVRNSIKDSDGIILNVKLR